MTKYRAWMLLLLLAVVPYLPSLASPFFADDYLHIERLQEVRAGTLLAALRSWILRAEDMGAWWVPGDLAVPYFRPLVTLSFFTDHALWGLRPFGYHLTNLLLHVATTLLCYGIARRVLRAPFGAFVAAALFALHPCHTEAVAWISGRTDLLAGCACAAAFYLHLRSRPLRAPGSAAALLGVLLCFLLGLAAKEMALTLPLLILGHNLLYPQGEPLRRRLAVPLLLGALGVGYLALRTALLGRGVPPHPFAHGPGDPDMLRQIFMALPLYLADLVLFVPAEPVLTFPFWTRHLLLFLGFCGLCALVLRGSLRESSDAAASRFGLLWTLLCLLPVLPVTVGERFLYLPSLGYVLLVGAKMPEAPRPAWKGLALAAVTFAVLFGKGWQFASMSHSSRRVIEEAVAAVDAEPRARRVLLIDLPAQSALAFGHALRLARPERGLQVEVLSIAPHFLAADAGFRSRVERGPDGVLVRSEGRPYLGSYIEQAYLANRRPLSAGEVIERPGYRVTVLAASPGDLRAFAVHFPGPEQPLLLRGSGFHLRPL